jgi:segregation and condensation protein B
MDEQVQLKQVLGAMIFAARHPLTVGMLRKTLEEVADAAGGVAAGFRNVKDADIKQALDEFRAEIERSGCGFHLADSAEGYRFQSDPAGGLWVRHMLDAGKPMHLSRPALETLAIVAYRQPIARASIEGVRGVNVDHVIRMLMEMQLIRIVGRSDLPGRPILYGTTTAFLEHFGLKDLRELPGIEELARIEAIRRTQETAAAPAAETVSAVEVAPPQEVAGDTAPTPSEGTTGHEPG